MTTKTWGLSSDRNNGILNVRHAIFFVSEIDLISIPKTWCYVNQTDHIFRLVHMVYVVDLSDPIVHLQVLRIDGERTRAQFCLILIIFYSKKMRFF